MLLEYMPDVMLDFRDVIAQAITLLSTASSGGHYSLHTSSHSGNVYCGVVYAPVDAAIHMKAFSHSGSVNASLPNTFEGSFKVNTQISVPSVSEANSDELDPSGEDRTRVLQVKNNINHFPIGGERSGWVFWSTDGKERGSVKMWAHSGSARLNF